MCSSTSRRALAAALLVALVLLGHSAAGLADAKLKQSTARIVAICRFLDVNDARTPVTTLTLTGADEAEALKANGAATVDISGRTWTAISGADGCYHLSLSASDTDTVGPLKILVQDDSLVLPREADFEVVEEAVYDAVYGAGAAGPLSLSSTITLPGQAAPPASPTVEEALAWPYKTFRNKKQQTASEWRLYDDAGTTVDSKAAVTDDGSSTTKAEIVSGP